MAVAPSILDGGSGNALSLLNAARTSYRGIGLSSRARALTSSYLDQSTSGLNTILSLGISQNADNNSLKQKILAIRAGIPQSQLLEDLRTVSPGTTGTTVDTTA